MNEDIPRIKSNRNKEIRLLCFLHVTFSLIETEKSGIIIEQESMLSVLISPFDSLEVEVVVQI